MTGFGRGVATSNDIQVTIEARAVNHRFLEINVKVPKEFIEFEVHMKKVVSNLIARGKLDLYLAISQTQDAQKSVHINWPLVDAYEAAKKELATKIAIEKNWTIAEISSIDQLLVVENEPLQADVMANLVHQATTEAIKNLIVMREREGQELKIVMLQLIDDLKKEIKTISLHAEDAVLKYRERLKERLKEIDENNAIIDQRILTEVAIYAERIDITEELDRLQSHIAQLLECMDEHSNIGRKIEFILQEMHREMNTIGSKNQSSSCSVAIVQSKMFLEKLREQVQNVE